MSYPSRTATTNGDAFSQLRATASAAGNSLGTLSDAAAVALVAANLLESEPVTNRGGALKGGTLSALGTTQNSTPTIAQLLGGVVTQTSATGAGTVTIPLGTDIDTGVANPQTGDTFTCLFSNLGGGFALTITGQLGSTVRGTAAIPSAKTGLLTFIRTGSAAWDCYVTVSA